MSTVHALYRTLEQELAALERRLSLECLVCGEFVLHSGGAIECPECGASLRTGDLASATGAATRAS